MSLPPQYKRTQAVRRLPRPARHMLAISLTLAISAGAFVSNDSYAQAVTAANESTIRAINLPAGPLAQSLNALAQQTGAQIIFAGSLADGKQVAALRGNYSTAEALQRLLKDTGLKAQRRDAKTYTLLAEQEAGADGGVLAPVTVSATRDTSTEYTNSYTTSTTSTATKMNLSMRETPQTISVITRQRIEDQQINSMTEVLNQVAGITMSQDGGRFNIYSRGSGINTYQIDGVTTMQDNQTRNMPNTLLDMTLYDRIEVVRGATGLMTGAGDPSGVVNLVRKRPTKAFQAHAQVTVGSWDYYRTEADLSGALTESGEVRGRVVAAKQQSNSFIDWYKQDKEIFYGALEVDLTPSTLLRVSMDYQDFKPTGATGVPLIFNNGVQTNFARSTSSAARDRFDAVTTSNYALALEQKLANNWQFKFNANYMDTNRSVAGASYRTSSGRSWINQATGDATVTTGTARSDQVQRGVDLTLQGPFELLGRTHEFITGFSYSDYETRHRAYDEGTQTVNFYTWNSQVATPPANGTLTQIFDVTSRQRGTYAATKFNLRDDLKVFVGARTTDYDYTNYLAAAPIPGGYVSQYSTRARNKVTPYAGIVYDLNEQQSLYVSYTDIFKPQSAQDRNGKVLDPVVGKNYELGWKGEFFNKALNASTAIYRIERDNVAEEDPGSLIPGTTLTASRAVKGAITKGIDLELTGALTPNWNIQTSYSHSVTRDAQNQRSLTNLPASTFRLWTTYRLQGAWDKLTVGSGVSWNSGTSLYFSGLRASARQDAYAVYGLMARYRFDPKLVATLNINNLFDKTYYSGMAGSFGHYGDPRNAMLTVRYDF